MLRSKKGKEIIRRIPRTRTPAETDGPFVKVGRREPRRRQDRVRSLSELWQEPISAVVEILYRNCTLVLSDPGGEDEKLEGDELRARRIKKYQGRLIWFVHHPYADRNSSRIHRRLFL
jgi:hypothetical protein